MTTYSDQDIQAIIARVRARLGGTADAAPAHPRVPVDLPETSLGEGLYATIDEAVQAAERAYQRYTILGTAIRTAVISSIRSAMLANAEHLAKLAHEETGLGRTEDKIRKNILAATRTPGPEDLEPLIQTGDGGMMLTEHAPFGIIGSITPTTNPTATIINNAISILSGGNAVVFNAHPNARKVSAENVRLLNRAVLAAGGPSDLVTAVPDPTIQSAQELMHHPKVRVLLVTGGPGVVREALKTDKRAITAGPGNPPAVVDETADLDRAGRDIVAGASFDNNVICTCEKTTIAVKSIADELVRAMERHGAHVLKEHELRKVERVIFDTMGPPGKPGVINRAWIGKNARDIATAAGVDVDGDPRLLVAVVPNDHNLVWTEQMMPVMPVTSTPDVDAAIDLAIRSEHRFQHTASIHSNNVSTITRMARSINVSIFIANGPNYAGLGQGGEGFTSFSIASPSGDGMTRPLTFTRERRIRGGRRIEDRLMNPALALLEFKSIAAGIHAGDAMIKRGPVATIVAGTVHPGRYLVMVTGEVGDVEEAVAAGIEAGGGSLLDRVLLSDVHPAVAEAVRGTRVGPSGEALGVIETSTVAATLEAADAAVKGATVDLLEVHLADGLGGKAYVLFSGSVSDVQAAVTIGVGRIAPEVLVGSVVIPQLHGEMGENVFDAPRFGSRLGWDGGFDAAG